MQPTKVYEQIRSVEDLLERACEAAFDTFYNVTQDTSREGWIFEHDEEVKAEWRSAIRAAFRAVEE